MRSIGPTPIWDPSVETVDYLREAERALNANEDAMFLGALERGWALLRRNANLSAVLNPSNWNQEKLGVDASFRPSVRVLGRINQLGHLTVRWVPASPEEEPREPEFVYGFETYAELQDGPSGRPRSELLWFKDLRDLAPTNIISHPAQGWLHCALRAAYVETLRRLEDVIQVVDATSFDAMFDRERFPLKAHPRIATQAQRARKNKLWFSIAYGLDRPLP